MSIVFCEFSSVHDARIFSCPSEAVCQLSHSVLTGFSPLSVRRDVCRISNVLKDIAHE